MMPKFTEIGQSYKKQLKMALRYGNISLKDRVIMLGRGKMFVSRDDNRGLRLLDRSGVSNPAIIDFWRLAIQKLNPDLVLDIGANYGEVSLSARYKPTASVHLFEPNPRIGRLLEKSLSSRADKQQFHLHLCAVSNENGTAEITIDRKWSGTSSLIGRIEDDGFKGNGHASFETVSVKTSTIDDIIGGAVGALLFKIDVEGWESHVLKGMRNTLKKSPGFVGVVEMDDRYLRRAGSSADEMIGILREFGSVSVLSGHKPRPLDSNSTHSHGDLIVLGGSGETLIES